MATYAQGHAAGRVRVRLTAVVVATLLAWSPVTPYLAHAQPPAPRPEARVETRAEVSSESEIQLSEEELQSDLHAAGVAGSAEVDRAAVAERLSEQAGVDDTSGTPISLPGGETPSAVSPQSISLPSGEGSIQGMGESFSPVLSSGTATFSVPIAVAPGRGGVQPSLALAYSTTGGNGPVGFGWNLGVPFIARQTDRGLPRYVDRAAWTPEEDRFIYNGGQELVPVDGSAAARVDQQAAGDSDANAALVPADVVGWQQYRARVEGGFMRFFRAPADAHGLVSSWVVQSKDGTRFDFGLLPTSDGPSELHASNASLELDDEAGTRVFRWMLTRMSDAHGSTVYYTYRRDRGQLYLSDVHYVSPHACGLSGAEAARKCTESLSGYGAHVHLEYEARADAFTSYRSGYPITTALRLHRVDVTAYDDLSMQRALVRRYRLTYEPSSTSFHSLLATVQVEGRPHTSDGVGNPSVPESALSDAVVGPLLPPMTFGYSSLPSRPGGVAGFGALSSTTRALTTSPPHSIDDARADFFDVNSDGLPDLIVTDPATYRTRDGAPAVGVFFNGFSGTDAQPGVAGEFSGPVAMPMRSDLSGVLSFTNLNIVPMDIDGDGRSDLLHMPRARSYGWFTPTRQRDADGAPAAVSPAHQGWRWTYATIDLPADDFDPRIDFGRDSSHIEIADVNADHLIDVVRTTGTSIQTWLNLGWVPQRDAAGRPAGDGRFGSATYDASSGRWLLSTQPITSCLLTAGTPLDFSDSESRLADMNGDDLIDLVRMRRGRVIWWPGRGTGSFGTGSHDCNSGFADGRYVEMATPPAELNVDLAGVQLADIDGDGTSDVVQVRFDAVDVWFNQAGQGFTPRYTITGTPYAPDFAPRVRLMDIDGSGTTDVVYADGSHWQWVDLLEHTRPRTLVSVDNGLGALTAIDYDTSATDYLRDLHDATSACTDESTGCDRFAWSRVDGGYSTRLSQRAPSEPTASMFHAAGTPVISSVVRRIRTSDRFGVYSADQVSETSFAYHEGYYEGIEQEFRGFGAADSVTVGDAMSPSVRTRTWFHQGRRPQSIADDRLAYSPDEALKGREYLTEVFDDHGTYLSTAHATLTSRTLLAGLDGRPIQYAFVSQADEIRYDTTPFVPQSATAITLPDVMRESVDASLGAVGTATLDRARSVFVRGARAVMIRTTYDEVDNLGQVRRQTAHGHIEDPSLGAIITLPADPPITSVTTPTLLSGAGWLWRTASSAVIGDLAAEGSTGANALRVTQNTYNATGDLRLSEQYVSEPRTYAFDGDPSGHGSAEAVGADSDPTLRASSLFDGWGQSLANCVGADLDAPSAVPSAPPVGCFRYATVTRDPVFDQLALSERAFTGATHSLSTTGTWDRGLGVLTSAMDPNGLVTTVTYDGLGRLTSVTPPAAEDCSSATPTTHIAYELTSAPATQPVSRVVTTTYTSCPGASASSAPLVSIGYVDGLGRVRATLATANAPEGAWVRAGLARLDPKGAVREAWQSDFYGGSDTSLSSVLAVPGESFPHTRSFYDAFGRVRVAYAEDGSLTSTSYHALSTDVCDPLDNDPSSMHFRTCTTARTDGHGRLIDQILRNRQDSVSAVETHRLWTYYRNDGAVLALVRARTSDDSLVRPTLAAAIGGSYPHVHRTFFYDSGGRRIGSDDLDTNDRANPDSSRNSWRYRFNRAGDLVAVRDPRGCGQNFFYDLGGRLVGEQYVGCAEAQSSDLDQPNGDNFVSGIGMSPSFATRPVDVHYFYDEAPDWVPTDLGEPTASPLLGRATGVADRAQRAAVFYDARGNAIWTARQVALLSEPAGYSFTSAAGPTPAFTEHAITGTGTVTYDEAHTYVRTASFDHAGRPTDMTLPVDPDWAAEGGTGPAPLVSGSLTYDARGLPATATLHVDDTDVPIVSAIHYLRDGLVDHIAYGELSTSTLPNHAVVESATQYDERRRPHRMTAARTPTGTPDGTHNLRAIGTIADQELVWDAASNLVAIRDQRDPREWPARFRPQSVEIRHDSLYRVVSALFDYSLPADSPTHETLGVDEGSDWRDSAATANAADPMHPEPAPMLGDSTLTGAVHPADRVQSLVWSWDWLGNMTEWTDDAQQFYERSIGDITNGQDIAARPSALYLASNLNATGTFSRGYVELDYGVGGNVVAVTAHSVCTNRADVCHDPGGTDITSRRSEIHRTCTCASEQHYQYRWDELNRISEARRFDRTNGGNWTFEARQRYRYDGANVRVVKQSFDVATGDSRVALYVYPGDYERRGLVQDGLVYAPAVDAATSSETQYLVAGARLVLQHDLALPGMGRPELDRTQRVTIPVSDLLHTTSATVDLLSGELLEVSTYYPNGARETLLVDDMLDAVALEPNGFTGKEADEDVGLVYFGERYLIARVGRWASPDPLHVYAAAGGEALNAYHYVSGNLLAGRDAAGLVAEARGNTATATTTTTADDGAQTTRTYEHTTSQRDAEQMFLRDVRAGMTSTEGRRFSIVTDDAGRRVLHYHGPAEGLSPTARMWTEIINSDQVAVFSPSSLLSTTDAGTAGAVIQGMVFTIQVGDHAVGAGEHLQLGGTALAGLLAGRGNGAMGMTARGSSGEVLVTYLAFSGRAPSARVRADYETQSRIGASMGIPSVEFHVPLFAETLGHESSAHVLGFFHGESHADNWSPATAAAAMRSGGDPALLARIRERSSITPLARSATVERDIAAHVRMPRGARPLTGAQFRERQIEIMRRLGMDDAPAGDAR